MAAHPTSTLLEVYVTRECEMCSHARLLAERVRAELPAVQVRVVDLESVDEPPAAVFAVPSFLVDGKVVSLGNPSWSGLRSLLSPDATAPKDQV